MQSEQVRASQLLGSFLGSESDKITKSVVRSGFAGELKKLIPESAGGTVEPSDGTVSSEGQAASGTKTCGRSSGRMHKVATDSKAKTQKSKAKSGENVFVTNSAAASTILADLQYPAETRQACKSLQNKQGEISIKDLKSFLNSKSTVDSATPAEVPAEHVQALVNSIIVKGESTAQKGTASGSNLQAGVQVKAEGSYTRSEVLGLLEKVIQQVESAQAKPGDSGTSTGSAQTIKGNGGLKDGQARSLTASALPSFVLGDSEHSGAERNLALGIKNPALETRSANVPVQAEDSLEVVQDKSEVCPTPDGAKTVSADYSRETASLGKTVGSEVGGSGPGGQGGADAVSASARQKTAEVPVSSLDSILKGFDATIVSTGQQQAGTKVAEDPVLGSTLGSSIAQAQNLASNVKGAEKEADRSLSAPSSSKQSQESAEHFDAEQIKAAPAEHTSSESSFDGDRNGATDSEKNEAQTSAVRFASKETGASEEPISNTEGSPASIANTTASAASIENTTESVESTRNTDVSQPQKTAVNEGGKTALPLGSEDQATGGARVAGQSEATSAVTFASNDTAASMESIRSTDASQPQKTDMNEGGKTALSLGAEEPAKGGARVAGQSEATSAVKFASKDTAASTESIRNTDASQPQKTVMNEGGKTALSLGAEDLAGGGARAAGQVEAASDTLRMGSIEDSYAGLDASVNEGTAAKTGLAINESESAVSGIDPIKTSESRVAALSGADAAIMAKPVDKKLGNTDSIPEGTVFQNSASSFGGADINAPRMENSAQNSPGYDPYQSYEFAKDMREQFASAPGRQLVLEMEPTELGKISLKVEAKKDEISVTALTDNESARQTLVKHSPELRHGLQDQGLVLDKFSVDVDRDKSGRGNYPEGNNPGGQNQPVSKIATAGGASASRPSYARQIDVQSQISVFA
jgi:flagellar hook-length control protein FliK